MVTVATPAVSGITAMLLMLCTGLRRRGLRHPVAWKSSSGPCVCRHIVSGGWEQDRCRSSSSSSRHNHHHHLHEANLITSPQSTTIKTLVALRSKRKARQERGETLVEGPRIVRDLLSNPQTRPLVRQVVVSQDSWDEYWPQLTAMTKLSESVDRADGPPPPPSPPLWIVAAAPHILRDCTDTVVNQGIVARVEIPSWDLGEGPPIAASTDDPVVPPLVVVSDGIGDPGNLGTLLRSSVATGVTAVLLLPGSCDVWSPKAIRSAMGATFHLPILPVTDWHDCRTRLQQWGYRRIYASTMLGDDGDDDAQCQLPDNTIPVSYAHYDVDWTREPTALVIGSEGSGLSADVRRDLLESSSESAIQAVHVPMEPGIESLNAGVCGSVILFEYFRQKRTVPSNRGSVQ